MYFIKKHATLLIWVGIIALFLFTRLYHILSLPIFTDEAIYIRWAQIAKNDPAWWFISLTDGKQPLYIWITILFLNFFQDPLLAGRIVSVVAGLFTTIGIFFVTRELFNNKKIAFLASLLYVLYPFALVYDRMALYDSLVAAFSVWSLYIEILFVKQLRVKLAIILGIIIGFSILTKSSAIFFLVLLPASLLLYHFKQKSQKKNLIKFVWLAAIVALISAAMYVTLKISPYYYIINQKNNIFIYPLSEWIKHPLAALIGNLSGLMSWLIGYTSLPVLLLIPVAFLFKPKLYKEKLLLVLWFIVPFAALVVFGKLIYPRFIFFMTIPLLSLIAFSLYHLMRIVKNKGLQLLVFIVFVFFFVTSDYFIVTNFSKAPIPQSELGQFYRGWPSGVGVNETIAFLTEKAKHGKVFVGTEGTFGLMPYALEIYLHNNPNITIKSYFWDITNTPPRDVVEASKKMPTYFVFYESCTVCTIKGKAPATWPVKTVFQIKKQEPDTFYTLYQIQ